MRFFQQVEERARAQAGVAAVGAVFPMPLGGRFWTGLYGRRDAAPETWSRNEASYRVITPGYFAAMGTRLIKGRGFTEADNVATNTAVVVDQRMAQRLWPDEEAVGQELGVDLFGNRQWMRVVGIVEHIRHEQLASDSRETIYFVITHFVDSDDRDCPNVRR